MNNEHAEKEKWDLVCSYVVISSGIAQAVSSHWWARIALAGILLYLAVKNFLARRAYKKAVLEEK